jgi:hypothetical protein
MFLGDHFLPPIARDPTNRINISFIMGGDGNGCKVQIVLYLRAAVLRISHITGHLKSLPTQWSPESLWGLFYPLPHMFY